MGGLDLGPQVGPQPRCADGPLGHGQIGPGALPRGRRVLPPLLTQTLTGGSRPSASPPTSRHRSGELHRNTGEIPASAVRCASFSRSLRTRRAPLHLLSPTLAAPATDATDGRLGQTNTDHHT